MEHLQIKAAVDYAREANAKGSIARAVGDVSLLGSLLLWTLIHGHNLSVSFTAADNQYTLPSIFNGLLMGAIALLLAFINSLVHPAIWAALFPTTTGFQWVHELRRKTWGFWTLISANLIMFVFVIFNLLPFFQARLEATYGGANAAAADIASAVRQQSWLYTAFAFAGFVLVPAWLINFSHPMLWLAEVTQDYLFRKLRMKFNADLGVHQAQYLKVQSYFAAGLANLTPAELVEATAAQKTLMLSINDTLGALVTTVDTALETQIKTGILGDNETIHIMDQWADAMNRARLIGGRYPDGTPFVPTTLCPEPPMVIDVTPIQSAPQSAPVSASSPLITPPSAAGRQTEQMQPAESAAESAPNGPPRATTGREEGVDPLTLARSGLADTPSWTYVELMGILGCKKTKAHQLISSWLATRRIQQVENLSNHYAFVDRMLEAMS